MAFEIIKSIVEAEQKAEGIKAQALVDAETMKTDAAARSNQIAADAKKQAKQEQEDMIAQAYADSKPQREKILEKSSQKCAEIKEAAAKRMDDATTAIIRKVVGIDGNC